MSIEDRWFSAGVVVADALQGDDSPEEKRAFMAGEAVGLVIYGESTQEKIERLVELIAVATRALDWAKRLRDSP